MFYDFVKDELQTYQETIKNSKIKDIVEYSIKDGKCIRAFIVKHLLLHLSGISDWRPVSVIELIHGSSLIIDDLPCMDNDQERRGKPSTFVKFGERSSILISFYVVSNTFSLLTDCLKSFKDEDRIDNNRMTELLIILTNSWSSTIQKLLLGQMLDLKENTKDCVSKDIENSIDNIILYKTSSLFSMSFLLGSLFSCKDLNFDDFVSMGKYFGVMFQIMDDSKDQEEDDSDCNYVCKYGEEKSLEMYNKSKISLIDLFEKNEVYTDELKNLIDILDSKLSIN